MAFWMGMKRKYYTRRKQKVIILRQILRFNYEHNLDMKKVLRECNDYLWEQKNLYSSRGDITSINYTEEGVKEYFSREDEILDFRRLLPVFILYAFGIIIGLIVFCIEFVCFYLI